MCNTYYFTVHLSFCNFTSHPRLRLTPISHHSPPPLTRKFHPSPLTLTPLISHPHPSHLSPPSLTPILSSPPSPPPSPPLLKHSSLPSLPIHQIYRLSLDNCGTHSSCVSCVQSANPLCGWCSTEKCCMPTDSCSTAGTFTGHNNASSCPAITNVSPEQAYIVNNETVSCTLQ